MISYRQATRDDADAIARLHAASWRANYRGAYPDAFLDQALPEERIETWRGRLQHDEPARFVELAFEGGALLGFICVYAGHDDEYGSMVDNLHVSDAAQGKGIGRALMQHAAAWLIANTAEQPVHLFVLEINEPARRFYEGLGGRTADVALTDVHGALVRRWRYVWPSPSALVNA